MIPRLVAEWTPRSISGSIVLALKLIVLDEAQRRLEAENEWWREHRDAKDLLLDEFTQTLERLRSMPDIGQRYRLVRGQLIQRVLMKKTGCHVYYFHDRERDLIEIHSIWGARRERGPRL